MDISSPLHQSILEASNLEPSSSQLFAIRSMLGQKASAVEYLSYRQRGLTSTLLIAASLLAGNGKKVLLLSTGETMCTANQQRRDAIELKNQFEIGYGGGYDLSEYDYVLVDDADFNIATRQVHNLCSCPDNKTIFILGRCQDLSSHRSLPRTDFKYVVDLRHSQQDLSVTDTDAWDKVL